MSNDLNNLREEVINSLEYHRETVKLVKESELENLIADLAEDYINNYDCKKLILELLKKEGKNYAEDCIRNNYEAQVTIIFQMSKLEIKADSKEKAYEIAEGCAKREVIALRLNDYPNTTYEIKIKKA